MPRLEEASHRLQVAIDNLEKVVTTRTSQRGAGQDGGQDGGQDQALRDALAAARHENAQLQQLAGTVSLRLDATIGRLRKLVG
ncbi:MAG: hypothetical protein RH942_04095 [Kiloniellaceae bacterium]